MRWRGVCPGLAVACLFSSLLVTSPASPASAGSALDLVTRDIAASLHGVPGQSVVVAAPLGGDENAPRGDELSLRVAVLLAGKFGDRARAHPQTARLGVARAIAGRAGALVYVQPAIVAGELRVTVDVYPSIANVWDRIRNPLPAPTGHAFASAAVDAEVRSFLPALLLEQARVDRAHHTEGLVLAAACGDIDGDGGEELVLVSRDRVAMGRVRTGAFVVEHAARWSALAPRAPVPSRDPLGGAAVLAGTVEVGTTDRGSVSLGADLDSPRALAGIPAPSGARSVCLVPQPAAGAFDGAPIDCAISRDPKPSMAVPAPRYDAFSVARVVDPRGEGTDIVVVREPSGRMRVKRGDDSFTPDGTFGAALAVGDLDQDGEPELAVTGDSSEEAITLYSLARGSTELRPRLRLPVPEPVRALAMCPPEADGAPALVAVLRDELWLVRAARAPDR